jgi:hypothetical protein
MPRQMAKINEREILADHPNICTPHFGNTGGFRYSEPQSISKNHIPPSDKISADEISGSSRASTPNATQSRAMDTSPFLTLIRFTCPSP